MTEDELRIFIEVVHHIKQLKNYPQWEYFENEVNRQLAAWTRRLESGTISDILEYKQAAGVVYGIRLVMGLEDKITDLIDQHKHLLRGDNASEE